MFVTARIRFRNAPAAWRALLAVLPLALMTVACSHTPSPRAQASGGAGPRPYAAAAYAIDAGAVRGAMRAHATCAAMGTQIPSLLQRSESAARQPNRAAFEAEVTAVERWLDAQPEGACPPLVGALAYVRAMCADLRRFYEMLHDADGATRVATGYGSKTREARLQAYVALHDQAIARAPLDVTSSWDAWRSEGDDVPEASRKQRFLINAGTDPLLLRADGSVGIARPAEPFVPLVHTPALAELSDKFVALQGQGPRTSDAAAAYARAGMAFAAQQKATQVWFVNVAGGQVPSFAEAVAEASRSTVVQARYVEFDGWRDGALVTPATAAAFAAELAEQMAKTSARGLLVVNCNAGLDRSGTINALVQLALWSRTQAAAGASAADVATRGHDAIDTVVEHLKQARPHSISSPGRYLFLHQAFQALMDGAPPPKA